MLTWSEYCAWRRTKCPSYPQNRDDLELWCKSDALRDVMYERARSEEQVHATLEFLGEVAELGTLLMDKGFGGADAATRDRIIDEIGDVFFCGAWVFAAHGSDMLERMHRLELTSDDDADSMLGPGDMELLKADLIRTFFAAGQIANNMKKRRYHSVDIDSFDDRYRVMGVFVVLNRLLSRLGSSVEEALAMNQDKLNRRFPDGYVSGGGIR